MMSKLINMYKKLKEQDAETLYLFKSGIFYIFLAEDAQKMSKLFSLKLTPLNNDILKCGFPLSSINKYSIKFRENNIRVKIIEDNIIFSESNFFKEQKYLQLIDILQNIDIDSLSVSEAYKVIETLKSLI